MIKMNKKNLMVFFLMFASIFLFVSGFTTAISNATNTTNNEIVRIDSVKINDLYATGDEVAVVAGETIIVKVFFTALVNAADVKVKIELEGQKVDVEAVTSPFNIEEGKKYTKTFALKIPYELQDETSDGSTLDIKIWNGDFKTENDSVSLRIQRPSYNAEIMSIDSSQTVGAGELFPVDIVLKNTGYNNLDDVYVTVKIDALGLERTSFFGDLVSIDDDEDTDTKRFFLQIPSDVKAGIYDLDVKTYNSDFSANKVKQITIENEFSSNVIVTNLKKSVAVNDDAVFELIIANPTNKLRVFRIVSESNENLATSSNVEVVAVPAGMTKTITVTAHPSSKGEYSFNVILFAGEEVVESVTLNVLASGRSTSNSAIALTIILIIVFLVLLGVLFVLLRKKSETSEEFGESYY